MLAKLIVRGKSRDEAVISAMQAALDASRLDGIETNLRWLRDVARADDFTSRARSRPGARRIAIIRAASRVQAAGTLTTVQDWPGRHRAVGCRRAAVRTDGRARPFGWATRCSAMPRQPPDSR
jgi:acetyl/propionyl-CoA carboxylase alpha subunit